MNFLVVYGSPIEGLTFCGPFDTRDEALAWADENIATEYDWWVSTIFDPKEDA